MIRSAETGDYSEVQRMLAAWAQSKDQEIINLSIWQTGKGWKARVVSRRLKHDKKANTTEDKPQA